MQRSAGIKGIIFNLLEEVIVAQLGERAWDEILESARADGAYTSLGNYPDQEFVALLQGAARLGGKEERATLKWFGRHAMPVLA